MDTGAAFVAHIQPPETVQPCDRPLDDPAGATQAAAVGRAALGQLGANAAAMEVIAMGLGVIGAVALDHARFAHGASRTSAQRGNALDQGDQLGDVVPVGGRQSRDDRNPLRVGEKVVLTPRLAAIGRVRSSFFPPRSARSEELSTTARVRSNSPRRCNSVSRTVCNRLQTPARCQRTRRRQQVVPEPQPISRGNRFHGRPLRSTKRMPVSTARSGMGFRPAYWRFRRGRFGSSGSMWLHKSSSSSGLVMHDRLRVSHAKVPRCRSKYKWQVS